MQLKPNETPDLYVGEKRRVTVNISGVAGVNTISSVSVTNDDMTVTSASSSGLDITFFLEATKSGTYYTAVSATLSSGEEPLGYIRTCVLDEPCPQSNQERYDD